MKVSELPDSFFEKLVQKQFNKIPQNLFAALNQLYENNWDVDLKTMASDIKETHNNWSVKDFNKEIAGCFEFNFPIIINFGDITINNGKNQHLITDLYVRLMVVNYFNRDYQYIKSPKGIRASATLEELKAGYFHSHLAGLSSKFQQFCLGSNYDLTEFFNDDIDDENKNIEHFLLMLFSLKQSLSWESISGTPYKYLERIGKTLLDQDIPDYISADILKIVYFTNLKFKITDNNIQILPTKELEQQLFDQIQHTSYNTYTCYKTEFGEYLSPSHSTSNTSNDCICLWENVDLFIFKGEMLKFKINNLIQQENVTNNAPNPKLTAGIIKELSNAITKKHITNSRIKKENIIESSKECSEANSILVL